jgi:hypothetical protein
MRYGNFFFVVTILFLSCACTQEGPQTSVTSEGFKPFLSARGDDFDPPGRIFRMDPDGKIFGVTQLKIQYQTFPEVLYKLKYSSEVSFEEVLQTIGAINEKLPVKATAELKYKRFFETESVNGQREISNDDVIDKALSQDFPKIIIRENNKYFIIRETIKTDNLIFRSDRSWLASMGIEGELKKICENNAKLNFLNEKEFSIEKKFDKPMRIWYKAESLNVHKVLGAGPGEIVIIKRTGNMAPATFMVLSETTTQGDIP